MDTPHNHKKESTALLMLVVAYGIALTTILTENTSTFLIVSSTLLTAFTLFIIAIMRDTALHRGTKESAPYQAFHPNQTSEGLKKHDKKTPLHKRNKKQGRSTRVQLYST